MANGGYAGQRRERVERLAQLKARGARRPAAAAAALSDVLAQHPSSCDGRKIAVVDKNIASLDTLPERYAGIKVRPHAT